LPRPGASVSRAEAACEIDRIAREGGSTTARRTLQCASPLFRWSMTRGVIEANPLLDLPSPGKVVFRDRLLTDDEVGAVWRACAALRHPHGPLIRCLLLTLARREEATVMVCGEVAANLSEWIIPGNRMKRGQPHQVHLSEPAKAILPRGEPDSPVFGVLADGRPALRPVKTFSSIKRTIDRAIARERSAPIPPWVFHEFRRTDASVLAARCLT
jgi:integrase